MNSAARNYHLGINRTVGGIEVRVRFGDEAEECAQGTCGVEVVIHAGLELGISRRNSVGEFLSQCGIGSPVAWAAAQRRF